MKKIILVSFACLLSFYTIAQMGGVGYFDLSYGTLEEKFIDAASDAFANPEIKFKESGIGFGAGGLFLFNKISVGGGGCITFISSDNDDIKFNVGSGYGTFGYNFVFSDELIVNTSLRLGGFGNTLSANAPDDDIYTFGEYSFSEDTDFTSGGFLYGAEVNVFKFFPTRVPGLTIGLSAYFMAPITNLTWYDSDDNEILGVEEEDYSHFGVSLKIGGGGFKY